MAVTSNLAITLLEQAQAQKEVTANQAVTDLDQFAGKLTKTVASGTTVLTTDEAQNGVIELEGSPAGSVTVEVPTGINAWHLFVNRITTNQTVQVRMTAGGTLQTVPRGGAVLLYGTGANDFAVLEGVVVQEEGSTVGTRPKLNFIGANLTAADDAANDRVNVTFTPSPVDMTFNAATVTWTDQPAGVTEFLGLNDRRRRFDGTRFTQARLVANVEVVGATGAKLRAEFATTDGGSYGALDGATGPEVLIDAAGTIVSGWVNLASGAKADVFLRIIGVGGDGAADPQIGLVALQYQ